MGFAVYLRKAVEEGKIIFPGDPKNYGFVQFCTEHKYGDKLKCLECLRKSKSAHSFSAQYFNDPVDSESVEFKSEWVRKFAFDPGISAMLAETRGILSIDPAVSLKETNDYTGFAICKVSSDRQVYVVEACQKRLDPDGVIRETFQMIDTFNVGIVLLETNASQKIFMTLFKHEMIKRNKFFSIEEVQSGTKETKAMRIRGLIPYYANGMILHRPGLTALEDQLLQFPRNTHDDIIDALSHQLPYWKSVPKGVPIKDLAPHGSLNWWKKQTSGTRRDRIHELFKDFITRG